MRRRFLSYWHVLELCRFNQEEKKLKETTVKDIETHFEISPIESLTITNRLCHNNLLKKKSTKGFVLGVNSTKLLEKNYPCTFLRRNPHTKQAKMRAKRRGKVFQEMI